MNSPSDDDLMAMLEAHAAQLAEHFGSVQIIATREECGDATVFTHGEGNYWARYGAIRQWLVRVEARIRESGLTEKAAD